MLEVSGLDKNLTHITFHFKYSIKIRKGKDRRLTHILFDNFKDILGSLGPFKRPILHAFGFSYYESAKVLHKSPVVICKTMKAPNIKNRFWN